MPLKRKAGVRTGFFSYDTRPPSSESRARWFGELGQQAIDDRRRDQDAIPRKWPLSDFGHDKWDDRDHQEREEGVGEDLPKGVTGAGLLDAIAVVTELTVENEREIHKGRPPPATCRQVDPQPQRSAPPDRHGRFY